MALPRMDTDKHGWEAISELEPLVNQRDIHAQWPKTGSAPVFIRVHPCPSVA